MAKKEFTYKGLNEEALKQLDVNKFMEIAPARIRRSLKRGFTDAQKVLLKNIRSGNTKLKTHCRDMVIIPEMIDKPQN